MNNITYDGELDLTDIKHIDVPEKDLSGCLVQDGDVLFNRTNSKDLVGKTCHFVGKEPMIIAGYIIRLRMNGKVLPEYVSTFMNLDRSKKLLYSMAKGAVGQANINAKEVQSIPIIIPPEDIQQGFLQLRKQSDKSKFIDFKSEFNEVIALKKAVLYIHGKGGSAEEADRYKEISFNNKTMKFDSTAHQFIQMQQMDLFIYLGKSGAFLSSIP